MREAEHSERSVDRHEGLPDTASGGQLVARGPWRYLGADDVIESTHRDIVRLAADLKDTTTDECAFAKSAYDWVRDQVSHSLDVKDSQVTVTATEVLAARTGLCYAKSHLLAAILRAQGVPAGLCYQRLSTAGGMYFLHGLVAIYLDGRWHRQDPRGNRYGINAQFSLGHERLAYVVNKAAGEIDYPEVYAMPAPVVLNALRAANNAVDLCESGLPESL
jgi:transglutaminase-like putative cysteine protease